MTGEQGEREGGKRGKPLTSEISSGDGRWSSQFESRCRLMEERRADLPHMGQSTRESVANFVRFGVLIGCSGEEVAPPPETAKKSPKFSCCEKEKREVGSRVMWGGGKRGILALFIVKKGGGRGGFDRKKGKEKERKKKKREKKTCSLFFFCFFSKNIFFHFFSLAPPQLNGNFKLRRLCNRVQWHPQPGQEISLMKDGWILRPG